MASRSGATIAVVLALAACSNPNDLSTPEARARAVEHVVTVHLEHELAVLNLLERHHADPELAEREVRAYLDDHREAIAELADKRPLLETEPIALVQALAARRAEHAAAFEARRTLEQRNASLMERPGIRAALTELDNL